MADFLIALLTAAKWIFILVAMAGALYWLYAKSQEDKARRRAVVRQGHSDQIGQQRQNQRQTPFDDKIAQLEQFVEAVETLHTVQNLPPDEVYPYLERQYGHLIDARPKKSWEVWR